MNKATLAIVLAATAATSAFAQTDGSQILNKNQGLNPAPTPYPYVLDASGAKLAGVNYVEQLFYTTSASSTSYEALGTPVPFRASTSPQVGTWNAGANATETMTDVTQGTAINVQVRVWDSSLFSSYAAAAAVAAGGPTTLAPGTTFQFGEGAPFAYTPPTDAGLTTPGSTQMLNQLGFSLTSFTTPNVPEPSMVALGAIGVGALLWRRRK